MNKDHDWNNDSRFSQDRLLCMMKTGDKEAFRMFYEQTARAIYSYALSIIKNPQDAEEIMQDTYVAAWTQCDSYEPNGKPLAWLFTIARNLCYGRLRRQSAHPSASLEFLQEGDSSWEPSDLNPAIEQASDKQALLAALDTLSEEERRLILLHIVASLKHREIADMLHLPLSTVLSKYHRALKKMQKEMQ